MDIGIAEDFTDDGVTDTWAQEWNFFLVRSGEKLIAVNSICSHMHCVLRRNSDDSLACPCHGSRFSSEGRVETGPATESLPRFGISKDSSGRIRVDTSRKYAASEWSDAGSYLKL